MISIDQLQTPPHNIDAERGVLCSVFLDPESMIVCDSLALQAEDFYRAEHAHIYGVMIELWSKRQTIDVVTVSDALERKDLLDPIGGADYLFDVSTATLTASVVEEYGRLVKEKSILRNVLKTTQQIAGDVYSDKETTDILDAIEKRIFALTQVQMADSLVHVRDVLDKRVEEYMAINDDPDLLERDKVYTGYPALDEPLSGLKPGELIILAARPSMGKTAFALNVALNSSMDQKKTVAIFSLEMGSEQIVDRMLSTVAEVPMAKFQSGSLDDRDFDALGQAMQRVGAINMYLDDQGAGTVAQLKSKLRKLKIQKGSIDLVIIDYLQLMSGGNNSAYAGNRVQEISAISRGLKELARELHVPILALSQLSRAVEQRPDKRPHLADLRESGAIEQDADSVMMLFREDYYDPDTERKGVTEVFIRKNRNGPVGEIELEFQKQTMKFVSAPGGGEPAVGF